MPAKYREMCDFHEYYSGARKAPYPTLFVGGNHEASNYLWELYYGGWVAPNIYYMGAANVIRFGNIRIAGLSGIWKGYDYKKTHFERLPYNEDDLKSIYHVRELDTRKLLQIRTQVDVGISHDWPRGVEWQGDWKGLFRKKEHLQSDAREGSLGSVAAKYVLDRLRPAYWFSAHLHVKYSARVHHVTKEPQAPAAVIQNGELSQHSSKDAQDISVKNVEEIELDMDDDSESQETQKPHQALPNRDPTTEKEPAHNPHRTERTDASSSLTGNMVPEDIKAQLPAAFQRTPKEGAAQRPQPVGLPPPPDIKCAETQFLALDKCLPHRDFLQILDIEALDGSENDGHPALEYDKEWLAITRVFAHDLTVGDPAARVAADEGEAHYRSLIEKEEQWVEENIVKPGKMQVPEAFEITAPVYDPSKGQHVTGQPREYSNPQTRAFCDLLQIPNPFHASEEEIEARMAAGPAPSEARPRGNWRGSQRHGFGHGRGGRGGRGRGRGRGRG